ncbi:SBBP repeat-containing protein [Sorangium sp. So ce726]|uniref:SBBP repeat-containing protein n=1 Tax=Sorangium sp. So ce726 TaxID=3133319 RepID=UPI003F5E88F8
MHTCGADGTWGACVGEVLPAVERCDAADDENCDGLECIVWVTGYEQTGDVHPMGIASDAEGNVFVSAAFFKTILIGEETFSSADSTDVLLLKLSPAGELLWAKQFGDISADNPWGLDVDSHGNLVVVGETTSGALDLGDGPLPAGAFVAQFDTSGEHIWSKGLGGSSRFTAVSIAPDDDIVVGGHFYFPIDFGSGAIEPAGGADIIVAKLDGATGLVTKPGCWARRFGDTGSDTTSAVAVDASGNIFVAGSSDGEIDFGTGSPLSLEERHFVMKLTPSGRTDWVTKLGGSGLVSASGLTVDASGRSVVVGAFSGELRVQNFTLTEADRGDAFLVQLEADGAVGWVRAFHGAGAQTASGVVVDQLGNLVVRGSAEKQLDLGGNPLVVNDNPGFIVKLTREAELVWRRLLPAQTNVTAVVSSPAGETLFAGWTKAVDADLGTGPLPGTSDGYKQRLVIAKLGR